MRYQVDITQRARRQIEELPGHLRQRVKRTIAQLAVNPRPEAAAELRGPLRGYYKIKLDLYRVVYRIEDDIARVLILKAGKKHSGFYDDVG